MSHTLRLPMPALTLSSFKLHLSFACLSDLTHIVPVCPPHARLVLVTILDARPHPLLHPTTSRREFQSQLPHPCLCPYPLSNGLTGAYLLASVRPYPI